MRILAGKLQYKKIKYAKDEKLRPTRNIVKKSFFDTVRPLLDGCVFLDLFAGVGSVGIEAISRGAKKVIFVDKSQRSIQIIKTNVFESGCSDKSAIIKSDANAFVKDTVMLDVDIVYVDAPYNLDIDTILKNLFLNVNKNAIVCVEHAKTKAVEDRYGDFCKIKTKRFGKNILDYFGVADE